MADYYTLVVALPWLQEQMEKCTQLPLSRIALEKRLTLLSDADRQLLNLAEQLYHLPSKGDSTLPDRDRVMQWQRQLDSFPSEALRASIGLRLEMQTLLAAFRYRRRPETSVEHFQGFGRWTPWIRRHWQEPFFGLETQVDYLEELGLLFEQGRTGDLQTRMDDYLWQNLLATERSHHFTLETVICFVLRWGLAEKRLSGDADAALTAFEGLSDELMHSSGIQQQLANMFEEFNA
ncbi:hypothetical protein LH51_05550 [Nitrincola sp. A-D6]|uniref:DUF2764 family protein n=1 Tax=Nitrincola sp. A-D6 TaxID=1545442 RepID=UPI00051FC3EB|nr:DUF2764 family protein [Nitrincola sp. A-D6]KGK42656.1 hypothetical protein LH51_05550 [Nitrincola sp. A-D6]